MRGRPSTSQDQGIDLLRGDGAARGPGRVMVGDDEHSADHVVIATGSEPVIPPVPGLAELEGIWTNREVTALTDVPRRLLVLGGGPVGVEMAQAVSRLGASVTLVEGADRVLAREPKPLGDALGGALRAEGIELCFGQHASAARREGDEYVLEFPTVLSFAAIACSWRPGGGRAWRGWGWRPSASSRSAAASPSTRD